MKKRRLFFQILAVLFFPVSGLFAQQAMELQVIGAAGSVLSNSAGATIHFTVGEMMVTEKQNNNILPQGFHQIVVWQIVPSDEPAGIALELKVYPNPTSGFLQIDTDTPVQASMFDLNGRMVLPVTDITTSENFDLTGLAAGTYFLQAIGEGNVVKSYKVQIIR